MNSKNKRLVSAIITGIAIGVGIISYDYFTKDEFDLIKLIFISVFSIIGLLKCSATIDQVVQSNDLNWAKIFEFLPCNIDLFDVLNLFFLL